MKRFLSGLLAFVCAFALLDVAVVCIGGDVLPKSQSKYFVRYLRCGGGHTFRRLAEARHTRNVDLLFIGTSHCYRSFDPRIFAAAGYTSFNLGTSMQSPVQTEALLKDFLVRIKPKAVIFEINPMVLGNNGVESGSDLVSNDSLDAALLEMVFRVNNLRLYNTLLYSWYKQASGTAPMNDRGEELHDHYVSGGYVQSPDTQNRSPRPNVKTLYPIETRQLEALDRALNLIRRENIPVFLVQVPITLALYKSKTNNPFIDSLLDRRGQYRNFNTMRCFDDRFDFIDDNHLSQRGARKFDSIFIIAIQKENVLRQAARQNR